MGYELRMASVGEQLEPSPVRVAIDIYSLPPSGKYCRRSQQVTEFLVRGETFDADGSPACFQGSL